VGSCGGVGMSDRGPATPVIDVRVRLRLGSLSLDVSFASTSERTAIVGPSGAGKSTLLRTLAGLEPSALGVVRVNGELWMDTETGVHLEPWRRGVGWVPQEALLFPHLSVRENLAYAQAARVERVGEVAALVRADHLLDRRPAVLSGGERQRVALARALLAEPTLLLLDEPFSALDRPLRHELIDRLGAYLSHRAVPLVLVSHDPDDATRMGCEELHLVEGHLTPE
jgi:ABC-type molybdate transport system ATPase subunit